MSKYWNGYKWCEDPPMASAQERAALVDAELNPPEVTQERAPLVSFDVSDVPVDHTVDLEVPVGEQPMPNMLETIPLATVQIEGRDKPTKIVAFVPTEAALDKLSGKDPVITDEVRERIRKELASKGDGGSK